MHFCTCTVALSGDQRHIMTRDVVQPVSWPEVDMIRHLHGEDAVADLVVIADVPMSTREEKARLGLIYGEKVVEEVYPGRNPQMSLTVPWPVKIEKGIFWKNPLTNDYENAPKDPDPVVEAVVDRTETVGDLAFLNGPKTPEEDDPEDEDDEADDEEAEDEEMNGPGLAAETPEPSRRGRSRKRVEDQPGAR